VNIFQKKRKASILHQKKDWLGKTHRRAGC